MLEYEIRDHGWHENPHIPVAGASCHLLIETRPSAAGGASIHENRDRLMLATQSARVAGALSASILFQPQGDDVRGERDPFKIGGHGSYVTQCSTAASAEPPNAYLKPSVTMAARAPIHEIGDQYLNDNQKLFVPGERLTGFSLKSGRTMSSARAYRKSDAAPLVKSKVAVRPMSTVVLVLSM